MTAIPLAGTDGNAATDPDPDWTPLRVTAPSPEYPSGHACFTTAVMTALGSFFGRDNLTFAAYSPASGTTRHYDSLQAATAELLKARISGPACITASPPSTGTGSGWRSPSTS